MKFKIDPWRKRKLKQKHCGIAKVHGNNFTENCATVTVNIVEEN